MSKNYGEWQLTFDENSIAWLRLDCRDSSVNTLSEQVLDNLSLALDGLNTSIPRGLVFCSGKKHSFILGANIDELASFDIVDNALALIRKGWTLFDRISCLPYATLALINGNCLGGGLELALSCRYRVAIDDSMSLGLPEVLLGIMPCWGGIKRLPEVVGVTEALKMILSGKLISHRKALDLGLIDQLISREHYNAEDVVNKVIVSGRYPRRASLLQRLLAVYPLNYYIVMRKTLQAIDAKDMWHHYPAPRSILDVWSNHQGNPLGNPSAIEHLLQSSVTRQLIRLFKLQQRLKKVGGGRDSVGITHVHLIATGSPGGNIVAMCALKGFTITVQGREDIIRQTIGEARDCCRRYLRDNSEAIDAATSRITEDPEGKGITKAQAFIETSSDNLEASIYILNSLRTGAESQSLSPGAAVPEVRETLTKTMQDSVKVHFVDEVYHSPLVEVIQAGNTETNEFRDVCAFMKLLSRLPFPVKGSPGLLVDSVVKAYILGSISALESGKSREEIDISMLKFGMSMGPLELLDRIGLDSFCRNLLDTEIPLCLREKIKKRELGKKSGLGFYAWKDGNPVRGKKIHEYSEALDLGFATTLVEPLVRVTHQLVEDGIVEDADLADAGVVFGIGYAPFSGGPLSDNRIPRR